MGDHLNRTINHKQKPRSGGRAPASSIPSAPAARIESRRGPAGSGHRRSIDRAMITSNWRLDRPELAWRSNRQMRTILIPPRAVLCRLASVQRGRQMTLEEIDKRILLRADLGQDDMIVAGLDVAIDRLKMALGRRSARYLLSYTCWRHV